MLYLAISYSFRAIVSERHPLHSLSLSHLIVCRSILGAASVGTRKMAYIIHSNLCLIDNSWI